MNEQSRTKSKLFQPRWFLYDFAKVTAALPGLLFFRPKLLYPTRAARRRIRGGALLIANHTGFSDPVTVQYAVWYRRHRIVCMKEFFEGKGARWFRRFRCIPIDREHFSMDSFREITGCLKAGGLVTMFPEGHITTGEDGGSIDSFKSGMVLMAHQSGCPIVPVYLKPRKRFQRMVAAIGEPVDVSALCGARPSLQRIEEVAETLHRREEALRTFVETGTFEEEKREETV